uniref:hypothetical protein n=1 Tax=Catenella fusiformis TaxID=3024791 RepID=UPI0027DA2080|nr:hypothetical protein REQ04_pgp149 [Catenella fusiformis]WCH57478.1 hypothetical protein [Catenella fusiformis]
MALYFNSHYFTYEYVVYTSKKKFLKGRVVKVITGLSNFNVNDVINKVKAAEIAGADYVDIAADPNLVSLMKSLTSIPICVSSINPRDLYKCVLAGADIVEIGNFDIFYSKKIYFSSKQIIKIAQEVRNLLSDTYICVTIPNNLLLKQQVKLAVSLQDIGINCVQTEGLSTKNCIVNREKNFISNTIYKSSATLSSTYSVANSINIPLITASGISAMSAPIAISYGASGVGIGSVLNSLQSVYGMSNYIKEIIASISYFNNHTSGKACLTTLKLRNINSCATVL